MRNPLLFPFFCIYVIGCYNDNDPHYPAEPLIEFKSIEFKAGGFKDTILLTFRYRDGDQNLGLDENELDSPYHYHDLFIEAGGELLRMSTHGGKVEGNYPFQSTVLINMSPGYTGSLVTIRTRKKNAYSFLPPFEPPASCLSYLHPSTGVLVRERDSRIIGDAYVYDTLIAPNEEKIIAVTDTLYYEINETHYNLNIDFLLEKFDGSFWEYDWAGRFCETFDARFPRTPFTEGGLFKSKAISKWEGEITYVMVSERFQSLGNMKLRVTITDRALNVSNEIETPVFSTR